MPQEQETLEVKVWLMVNSAGEYEVATDYDELSEKWTDENTGFATYLPQRLVQVVLKLPKPTEVVVTAELPAEPQGAVEVKVA